MKIKKATVFKTEDGQSFDTRAAAAAHSTQIVSKAQLQAALDAKLIKFDELATEDDRGTMALYQHDVVEFIASNRTVLLAALTVRAGPGRKPGSKNKKVTVSSAPSMAAAAPTIN